MPGGEIASIVETLYARFFLRDLLGKVLPGLILLGTLAAFYLGYDALLRQAGGLSFFAEVVVFAFAWLTGVAIQWIGHLSNITRDFPADSTWESHQERMLALKRRHDWIRHNDAHERIVVLKEATGNGAIALMLAVLWVTFQGLVHLSMGHIATVVILHFFTIALVVVATGFLFAAHRDLARRQATLLAMILASPDTKPQ